MNTSVTTTSTGMYKKVTEDLKGHLRKTLSDARYTHSVGTAGMCRELCLRFGYDADTGYLAGLGHDLAREYPKKKLLEAVKNDCLPADDYLLRRPVLLHGIVAESVLRQRFGIREGDILEAVRHHTLGHPEMGVLGRILYVADYCEPSRSGLDNGFRRRCLGLSLEGMVLHILEHEKTRRQPLAPVTRELYDRLRGS